MGVRMSGFGGWRRLAIFIFGLAICERMEGGHFTVASFPVASIQRAGARGVFIVVR